MTSTGKLPIGQVLALATLALIGSMALVGLINTARWAMALPPEADLSMLPAGAWMAIAKLALQFLAGLIGFLCILFGSRKVARNAAISAIVILLLLHLANWGFGPPSVDGSFVARHGLRLGFALWLLVVLIALVPNVLVKQRSLRNPA